MLNVKVKTTEIRFSKYTFNVEVNFDSRFFTLGIFSIGFQTETEQKQKHMKWRRIILRRLTKNQTRQSNNH